MAASPTMSIVRTSAPSAACTVVSGAAMATMALGRAPRSVRTRYAIVPSTDGRWATTPKALSGTPPAYAGMAGSGSGSLAKPEGRACVTLPWRSSRITASRRPASVSASASSARRSMRVDAFAMARSSRSTRSTRLARVSWRMTTPASSSAIARIAPSDSTRRERRLIVGPRQAASPARST